MRRKEYLSKFAQAHEEQMNDAETGNTYWAGVALEEAKKSAKQRFTAAKCNPKQTPKHLQSCAYYSHYYSVLGYTTTGNKQCRVNSKPHVERKTLMAKIHQLTIDEKLVQVHENCK